ncbi:hypothetical protein CYMTET_37885 [Cymbomonas tetramitiformis]|uniref:Uncharacterized protein n=1 Tax=Cymbomonas tetramitiformis TaxID=36881 RepID=A0AAE0CD26_9CHLO|nr:hypothetical protein CYMTET_37885 [Cymbomonas tetramitiformis]
MRPTYEHASLATPTTGLVGSDAGLEVRDPLADVLLKQVETLMRDNSALREENQHLQKDNEALQELVGFLSQGVDEEDFHGSFSRSFDGILYPS